ncbi:MAG: metallopeptidase TldD-related protein [Acidobacteriota bacterium]
MRRLVVLLLLASATPSQASAPQVLDAMKLEVQRAMSRLRIEGLDAPYFVSLRMDDSAIQRFSTAFGSAISEDRWRLRQAQAIVRVGSPALDQTNFAVEPDYSELDFIGVNIPLGDDEKSLRQAFWLAIDRAYTSALGQLSKKKGYLEKHPQENYPADFLPPAEKTSLILPAAPAVQIEPYEEYVRKLSEALRQQSFLTEGQVNLQIVDRSQYYVDSEENQHLRPEQLVTLTIRLAVFTNDWYPMRQQLSWVRRLPNELPSPDAALAEVRKKVGYVQACRAAEPVEEYVGPVVFSGQAACRLFLDILGRGLGTAREPLSDREGMYSRRSEGERGFLAKRFGQRILPPSFDVWDRPSLKEFGHVLLAGYLPVDDEGARSLDVQLVNQGRLVALPMRRTATKKYAEPNGHARGSVYSFPESDVDSAVTNLLIEDKQGLPAGAFLDRAVEVAEAQGKEELLVLTALRDFPGTDWYDARSYFGDEQASRRLISEPGEAYLLDVKTRERRPVWGLTFSDADERVLSDIVAATRETTLGQWLSPDGLSNDVPVSIVAPDVLIEEMPLERFNMQRLRAPSLDMPPLDAPKAK